MKKITMVFICTMFVFTNIFAQSAKTELEKAQKAGKSTYLVVSDKLAKGADVIVKLADDAIKKVKNTVVVKLNRDDKANADLIAKYRLSGANLPLVLVVASNGTVSGSLTAEGTTVEKLISFLPSKNQADVLLGFENGKAALIICGKKNASDRASLETECKKAMESLGKKANIVFIDIDSKEEKNFLDLIKPDIAKTTVLIFNGQGQYTGTLESSAKSDAIVKSVNKKAGGCAPGSCGSGKKC